MFCLIVIKVHRKVNVNLKKLVLILKIERLANDVMGRTTLTCSDSLISIYCNKRISNVRITIAFTVQVNATVSQISHSQRNDYAESN